MEPLTLQQQGPHTFSGFPAPLPPAPPQQQPPQPSSGQPDGGNPAVTLLVKHLPDALPADTLMRLFSHYGASDLRACVAGRLKNCAFVDFEDEGHAARAQSQLHRLRFLGKILSVDKAKPFSGKAPSGLPDGITDAAIADGDGKDRIQEPPPLPPYPHPHLQGGPLLSNTSGASESTVAMAGRRDEAIAPSLGVDYPFPPHLEYAYPPPDGNILTNIVNALIAVPRFYTQVLHLMNKMNLPAPFRPALPTPPLPPPAPTPAAPKRQAGDLSSDESELESSEETRPDGMDEGAETAELGMGRRRVTRKRAKHETSFGSSIDKDATHEAAGAKPTPLVPKEKPTIKKRQPVLQINISSKGLLDEHVQEKSATGLEVIEEVIKEETVESRISATREELEAGKMPVTEIVVLPMFKNYTPGTPTPVLYIKNLAKDVAQEDLFYVFGAVFPRAEDAKSQLGIKLMQEGRMRGQAFVTFPSTELAQDALNTVHGFVLKGKPMIVQFGRNPTAAKTSVDSNIQI